MSFPDGPLALKSIVSGIHSDVVSRMPDDFNARAEDGGIVSVLSAPGAPPPLEPFERVTYVEVAVYTVGLSGARDLSALIRDAVLGPQYTSEGVLDDVFVVTEPYEVPYPSDVVVQFIATYGTVARPA